MIRSLVSPLVALTLLVPTTPTTLRHAPARRAGPSVYGVVTAQGPSRPVMAHVAALGTQSRTVAGADGRFALTLPDSLRGREVTIAVRALGYSAAQQRVRVSGDSIRADFVLSQTVLALSEVTVTSAVGRAGASPAGTSIRIRGATALDRERRPGDGATHDSTRHFNTEAYDRIQENPFLSPREAPRSTFSIDVDRASYANVRRFIAQGKLPPADAVRLEEMVNYFPYDYAEPVDERPVRIRTDVASAPWAPAHRLVRVALQGRRIATEKLPPSNLVFLIDVSGSMQVANKLPLVKTAFLMLVDQLREDDHVAIVVYAGAAGLVLPSTPGSNKLAVRHAIEALEAGGSTAGGAGIRLAYQVAKENFVTGGNNRVILATDGDFNIGASSDAAMEALIEEKRKEGTFLTVLGFGMGNYKDSKLEKLADRGNGNYAYIDSPLEARKVFVHEFGGTMVTVAKDVKLQIEFNPVLVKSYRLLGYENRLLRDEDFNDDAKDAGEIGSGHSVTALYEVVPVGAASDPSRETDPLRYQTPRATAHSARGAELMYVKLRYKERDGTTSRLMETTIVDRPVRLGGDFAFAAGVAEFAMLLRDSKYKGGASIAGVLARSSGETEDDPFGYRRDFAEMVRSYAELTRGFASGVRK